MPLGTERPNITPDFEKQLHSAVELGLDFHEANNDSRPIRVDGRDSGYATIASLSEYLYTYWYLLPGTNKAIPEKIFKGRRLAEIFRAAHEGSYHWEKGWEVVRVSNKGRVIALRGEEKRILTTSDYISMHGVGLLPRPGSPIKVVARRDSESLMPGFWVTFSASWSDKHTARYRIYWNLLPEGAPVLVREITRNIDPQMPYCLKLPSELNGYNRSDAAVLYLTEDTLDVIGKIAASTLPALRKYLSDSIPMLTFPLGSGVSFAEEPASHEESFGMNRCRLISEGLFEIIKKRITSPTQRMHMVHRKLWDGGVSPQQPYLSRSNRIDVGQWFFDYEEN